METHIYLHQAAGLLFITSAIRSIHVSNGLSDYYYKSEYRLCILCRIYSEINKEHHSYNIERYLKHLLVQMA